MDVTDRVCNLECMHEGNVHEFVGPVKIVLVDPPEDEYKRRKAGGAIIALANFMMGANVFCMLLFCMGFHLKDFINSHIILCTIGYQLCMPYGILMLNPLFGAASPMKQTQRRIEHLCLQFLGMAFYVTGTVFAVLLGEKSAIKPPPLYTTVHCFAGISAPCLIAVCILIGPCLLLSKREQTTPTWITSIHRIFGVIAFVISTVCFISGVMKPIMEIWFNRLGYKIFPYTFVVTFCVFYNVVVITPPIRKCFARLVAAGFCGLCLLSGPCLFCMKKEKITCACFTYIHRYFGMFAFISGTVCFVYGILKPSIQIWLYILGYMAPTYLIVFFSQFYSLVVITTPISRCCERRKKKCPK